MQLLQPVDYDDDLPTPSQSGVIDVLTVLNANFFDDPSLLGWPVSLPIEIALKTAEPDDIRQAYNITHEQWESLHRNQQFIKAVADAREKAQEEGFSFRMKAQMQAEELLKTSWQLIHDKDTPANVKADLIKFTTRVAGYEPEKGAQAQLPGTGFAININFKQTDNTVTVNQES